jgi:hypothetical protein
VQAGFPPSKSASIDADNLFIPLQGAIVGSALVPTHFLSCGHHRRGKQTAPLPSLASRAGLSTAIIFREPAQEAEGENDRTG